MAFRYLVFSGFSVWGKNEMTKEYFIGAAKRDNFILDLENGIYFDKDSNSWKDIKGDE